MVWAMLMRVGPAFGRPQNRRVRIGNRFQASHARGDDKQAQQKCPIRADVDGWNKPEGAGRNQRQPDQDPAFVAESLGNQSCGNRHQEVGQIIGCLHQTGLLLVDPQRVLKVLVEDVNHPVAEAPQKEQ